MGVRDNAIRIFEEQRELTDGEMQAYKDMLQRKKNDMEAEIKPCPFCGDAWVYISVGDYGSGYEVRGYRMTCKCGYAWKSIPWRNTDEEVIEAWNKLAKMEEQE